jgi:hypothetical protein
LKTDSKSIIVEKEDTDSSPYKRGDTSNITNKSQKVDVIVERKKTLTLDSNFNKELSSNSRNTLQLLPLYQGTTESDKKRLISKKILNHIFKES